MITRCKFTCQSETKTKGWSDAPFLYEYRFQVVTGGSDEDKKFFAATPGGEIRIAVVRESTFVPGKTYYFDISEAE